MKKLYPILALLTLLFGFLVPALAVSAENAAPTASAPILSAPAGLPALPPLSPLATQLGQTLQTLVGPVAPVSATTPATDNSEDNIGQITDTFTTSFLDTLAQEIDRLKADNAAFEASFSALPDIQDWLHAQSADPRHQALWNTIGTDIVIIIGVPFLIGLGAELLLMPIRHKLRRHRPSKVSGRFGLLLGLFGIRMIPILVFLAASLLLLNQNESHRLARFVILNIINALALGLTIQQIIRGIFAPNTEQLRPVNLSTPRARSAYVWLSTFSFIIIYSYFLIDVATSLRVPNSAIIIFQNTLALILTILAIIVIFRSRGYVTTIIRGHHAPENMEGFNYVLRAWIARRWAALATVYLIMSLGITWFGVDNGFALMLRGTIFGVFILAAVRLAFTALDDWQSARVNNATFIHRQMLAFLLRPTIWVVAIVGIAAAWGVGINKLFATPFGQRVCGAVMSILITLILLTVLYELLHNAIERHLNRRDADNKSPVASDRARTLLPMLRNAVFIFFCAIALLICLSSVGFNIAPLLAGAGVLGVAIGFGSQTLVKDFLNGLFILAENSVAVGDVVKIGTFSGVIEALSIRTIRLRDIDGSLHILPFSEVSKITNMTRGFGYALVDINVAYDSDLEHVMAVLREIGAGLQEDVVFKRVILEPIEVMGVENLGDSAVTIRARIRTRPGKQWDVRRLLLLRIKQRFDKENIELPFPTVTHITKTDGL